MSIIVQIDKYRRLLWKTTFTFKFDFILTGRFDLGIMDLFSLFQDNLRTARENSKLNQRELSKQCDFDESYVHKIENGHRSPSLKTIEIIASNLDIQAYQLLLPPDSQDSND